MAFEGRSQSCYGDAGRVRGFELIGCVLCGARSSSSSGSGVRVRFADRDRWKQIGSRPDDDGRLEASGYRIPGGHRRQLLRGMAGQNHYTEERLGSRQRLCRRCVRLPLRQFDRHG